MVFVPASCRVRERSHDGAPRDERIACQVWRVSNVACHIRSDIVLWNKFHMYCTATRQPTHDAATL